MTESIFTGRPGWRIALAACCIVFPFAIYLVAIWRFAGGLMTPPGLDPATIGLAFREMTPAVFAGDMIARERYTLTSTLMLAVALGVLAYALGLIWRRRGAKIAAVAAALATATGVATTMSTGNPLRDLVVELPMARLAALAAEGGATVHGLPELRQGLAEFVLLNSLVGLAAVAAVMLRFADLTLGRNDDSLTAEAVAHSAAALRQTIIAGGAILTTATIATYFYYHYPLALMTAEAEKTFRVLAGIGATRWGAAYTLILAAAAAPAVAVFIEEHRRAKTEGGLSGGAAAASWLSMDTLAEKAKLAAAVLGVLAPALSAPLIEFLKLGG